MGIPKPTEDNIRRSDVLIFEAEKAQDPSGCRESWIILEEYI
jgi:hypothetical protein